MCGALGSNECDHQSLDQSKLSLGPTICKIHRAHSIFHLQGGGWFRSRGDSGLFAVEEIPHGPFKSIF
jgi:hypothetical protein